MAEIMVHSSYVRRKDMDSVLNCLVTDKLGPGEYTEKLLKAAKERFGFDYCVAFRSPVFALDAALDALGVAAGDSIALSPLSQTWVAQTLVGRGLIPVWIDVDEGSASIGSSLKASLAATPVKALYLAEPWGIMPDPSKFDELGIPIIEDAGYSLGANAETASAGSIGALTLIGMEHAQAISSGGGALLYARGRREGSALRSATENLSSAWRLGEMNAALALPQVKDLDKFLSKRRELAELYAQSLARSRKRSLVPGFECEPSAFGLVVVFESGVKDARAYAKKKEVETAMAFDDSCQAAGLVPEGLCPTAASLVNRCVAFPLNQRIGKSAAQKIAKVLATLP